MAVAERQKRILLLFRFYLRSAVIIIDITNKSIILFSIRTEKIRRPKTKKHRTLMSKGPFWADCRHTYFR
jgi:hypothetical protein